ncbi:MAG TPA: xanthine dehydrogenase family protein molybdopterin-binding subunit [Acidobacteriota bacterium]|nr:xanthine dehydrogenase family protein molybdopterin-binding subunit [Acidobacteriota bacterium]
MPDFNWPEKENRWRIGRYIERVDGPPKVSGAAEYTYDVKLYGMLYAKMLTCPYAHARITSIDTSAAETMPGVHAVHVIQGPGTEIQWAADEIAVVAAETEEIARDAVQAIRVQYEVLPHVIDEEDKDKVEGAQAAQEEVVGDPDAGFQQAARISEGYYGARVVAHSCMEAHGVTAYWEDDEHLVAYLSTQSVSVTPGEFAEAFGIPAANVRVICQHMGGGFGSKFSVDRWGVEGARLAKMTKRPVKLMLERDHEMQCAGGRPSTFARVKLGAKSDGEITAWESETWGTGGPQGTGSPPVPYVFEIPNRRHRHTSVPTHTGPARAWRAPNHPQACFVTMAALDDLAAALNMDPLDFFLKNIEMTGTLWRTYEEELKIGADLIRWKANWRPRGQGGDGPVKRGLGLSLHTWGGRGHQSNCELLIHPDGGVEIRFGSQDLGTGTRTVIATVVADGLGLEPRDVVVRIGDSRWPASGASGGSTTVGGVSSAARRAVVNALDQLFKRVAPELEAKPEELEAINGRIQVRNDPQRFFTWKEAASMLGVTPLSVTGQNPGPGRLIDSGVGGIQMADVSVDTETGVVKINHMVAVQDCGLIIDMLTARSQVYGGMIMGISYALFEERVIDPVTGRLLNDDMEFYKLAGIGDVGKFTVHMMTGPGYDERGVIGLGEPPVISPGAAISNAVANAIGVRVPYMPITPDRVLAALEKGGQSA